MNPLIQTHTVFDRLSFWVGGFHLIIQSILGTILAFFIFHGSLLRIRKSPLPCWRISSPYTKVALFNTILFGGLFFCLLEITRMFATKQPSRFEGLDNPTNTATIKTALENFCKNPLKGEFTFNDATQQMTCKIGEQFPDQTVQQLSQIGNYDKPSNTFTASLYNLATYSCKMVAGNPGIVNGMFTCSAQDSYDETIQGGAQYFDGIYDEKNKRGVFPQIMIPNEPTAKPQVTKPSVTTKPPVTTKPSTANKATNLEKECENSLGNWVFDSGKHQGICIYADI